MDTNTNITLVDYSEKAIALIGNTKPIKDDIKNIGGRFNKHLNVDGEKVVGWIFSKKKLKEVQNLLEKQPNISPFATATDEQEPEEQETLF